MFISTEGIYTSIPQLFALQPVSPLSINQVISWRILNWRSEAPENLFKITSYDSLICVLIASSSLSITLMPALSTSCITFSIHLPSQAALHLMQITSWLWYRWIATWEYETNIFPQLQQLALWSVILWWNNHFLPDNLLISLKVVSHLSHLYSSIFHLHNFNRTYTGVDTSSSSELLRLFLRWWMYIVLDFGGRFVVLMT